MQKSYPNQPGVHVEMPALEVIDEAISVISRDALDEDTAMAIESALADVTVEVAISKTDIQEKVSGVDLTEAQAELAMLVLRYTANRGGTPTINPTRFSGIAINLMTALQLSRYAYSRRDRPLQGWHS